MRTLENDFYQVTFLPRRSGRPSGSQKSEIGGFPTQASLHSRANFFPCRIQLFNHSFLSSRCAHVHSLRPTIRVFPYRSVCMSFPECIMVVVSRWFWEEFGLWWDSIRFATWLSCCCIRCLVISSVFASSILLYSFMGSFSRPCYSGDFLDPGPSAWNSWTVDPRRNPRTAFHVTPVPCCLLPAWMSALISLGTLQYHNLSEKLSWYGYVHQLSGRWYLSLPTNEVLVNRCCSCYLLSLTNLPATHEHGIQDPHYRRVSSSNAIGQYVSPSDIVSSISFQLHWPSLIFNSAAPYLFMHS